MQDARLIIRKKRLLEGLLIFLITFLLIFGLLEVCVRIGVAVRLLPDVPRITTEVYRLPYQNAPFDLELFLNEQFGAYNITYDQASGLWLPVESQGELVSHVNGFRTTSFQPDTYQATIYMFGGSTLYSTNTPNEWTIPSQLQKVINQSGLAKYRVVNVGLSGYDVAQQNLRLQQLDLQDGDIIIYYDGTNNIFMNTSFSTLRANNLQEVLQNRVQTAEWVGKMQRRVIWLLEKLADHSRFFHYIQTFRWDLLFSPIKNPAWQQKLVDQSVAVYQDGIADALRIIQQSGRDVVFVHFLQPTLFSLENLQGHELTLLASYGTDYTYKKTILHLKSRPQFGRRKESTLMTCHQYSMVKLASILIFVMSIIMPIN